MSDANGNTRRDSPLVSALGAMNAAGLAQTVNALKAGLLDHALSHLRALQARAEAPPPQSDNPAHEGIRLLLNAVGPAAGSAAVEYALARTRGRLRGPYATDYVANVRLLRNEDPAPLGEFDGRLREYLLPRYSYIDFDRAVDPRRLIDSECGYPRAITPAMYRYLYERDDTAQRVNDIYPDECWAVEPSVYEDDDEEVLTPFEGAWRDLREQQGVLPQLYRLDKLCGVGRYGVLLLGLDDGRDLAEPVPGVNPLGRYNPSYKGPERKLLYTRPFDEYTAFIESYDTDTNSPRYGQPLTYNLVFIDMTFDAAGGGSAGTRVNRRVHWTRVIHVADNRLGSPVVGEPRMRAVFNRLLDLRKIKGGSAEMLWKGGFPGIAFEIDPQFVADDPEFDREELKRAIRDYAEGMQRYLDLVGVTAKTLNASVADPEPHARLQMQAIAMNKGVPLRILMGSEEGRLASSQDKVSWGSRCGRRVRTFVDPDLLRALVDRLVAVRVLPVPRAGGVVGRYLTDWPDPNVVADEDRANLALKYTQALSQYVATGMIHLIQPMDFLTTVMQFRVPDARRIVREIQKNGGWATLLKVDPSQGAGVNGVRRDISPEPSGDNAGGRSPGQDPADRRANAMKA